MKGRASKQKGNRFEYELVAEARKFGLKAERARGSDGRSLGHHETVDIKVEDHRIQAKVRASLPAYLKPNEHQDSVAFLELRKGKRGDKMVLLRWDDYLALLKNQKQNETDNSTETGTGRTEGRGDEPEQLRDLREADETGGPEGSHALSCWLI